MKTRWLAVGAAAMLLLAACNNAEPTPNPELAFCDSLDALDQSVADVEAMSADSTVDDVESGMEAVEAAAATVKDTAGDLAESQVEAIDAAAQELADYRGTIEGTETVEEVIAGFADQVVALKAARQQAGETHCGLVQAEAAASQAAEQIDAAASQAAEALASCPARARRITRFLSPTGNEAEQLDRVRSIRAHERSISHGHRTDLSCWSSGSSIPISTARSSRRSSVFARATRSASSTA